MLSRTLALTLAAGAATTPFVHAAPAPAASIVSSLTSAAGSAVSAATSDVASLTSEAASAFQSAFPSAVLSLPGLSSVEQALGIDNSSLASQPISALLVPSYSNFTQQGWNVRFNAFIYRAPASEVNASSHTDLLKLLGIDGGNLNATEMALLNNRTTDLASLPVPGISNITASVVLHNQTVNGSIALQAADDFGEIDQFVLVPGLADLVGNATQLNRTVVAEVFGNNLPGPANSTTILVPEQGYSIVSDIDDVLRVTKVYVPTQGLANSFIRPYQNYADTPQVFAHWNETLPGVAFHYDTTTPLELTRTYVEYLFDNYPLGSLEMRPINLTEPSQVLDARSQSLERLFQSFPSRKFVLIGDTSSSSLLSAYPQIAQKYPQQLACIFIRNTSATDPDDKLPYSTSDFKNVNASQYFFYVQPTDLLNLDIAGGQCVNQSIPQNVTFGEQGGPFRL